MVGNIGATCVATYIDVPIRTPVLKTLNWKFR